VRASQSPGAGRRAGRSRWNWLLAVPVLLPPAAVPFLNRTSPDLFGMPFFYWCQVVIVAFSMISVVAVCCLTWGRR